MKFKSTFAFFVALLMILSSIPAMTFTASAAEVVGDWDTYRAATDYKEPDPETGEIKAYRPAPGYTYTEEGFTTIPADYTNTTPFMTVQSKEKQSVKDGIYMEFRIDDYAYGGEDGASDHWIAISLWSQQKVSPGNVKNGEGWVGHLRAPGGGAASACESSITVAKTDTNAGSYSVPGIAACNAPQLDDEGREIYTYEVSWNGSQYEMKINGSPVAAMNAATTRLEEIDPNGEFYVGITLYSVAKNGAAALSILKYGTSESTATIPVGSDSKEPEENINVPPADIADPSTVPADQPCVAWDANTVNITTGGHLEFSPMGDGSYHVVGSEVSGYFSWHINRKISYDSKDFPVFAFLLRNYWGSDAGLFYCAGDVVSANANYYTSWSPFDGDIFSTEEDEYTLVFVDLADMWEGRINSVRLEFGGMTDADMREFDICWMGFFRNEDEARAYNQVRLKALGVNTEETEAPTDEVTEAPTDEVTEAPTDEVTEAPTNTPDENPTEAPTGTPDETDGTDDTKKGCGSVVGMSAAIILTAAAAAYALHKKD